MGNPVITRLGINQFWYRHWYTDTKYHNTIKEDTTITTLVSFYLNHGVIFKSNPFLHEYWYKQKQKSLHKKIRIINQDINNLQSFERFFYTNDRLGIEHSYLIRHRTGEYFPMRIWLMRYGNWLFLSVHWFKPLKTKKNLLKKKNKLVGSVWRSTATTNSIKRLSLLKSFITSKTVKQLTYMF